MSRSDVEVVRQLFKTRELPAELLRVIADLHASVKAAPNNQAGLDEIRKQLMRLEAHAGYYWYWMKELYEETPP